MNKKLTKNHDKVIMKVCPRIYRGEIAFSLSLHLAVITYLTKRSSFSSN